MVESWLIAECFRDNQRAGSFLYPAEQPSQDLVCAMSEQVSVTWQFPSEESRCEFADRIQDFNNAISDICDHKDLLALVLVMSRNDYREWCFYTSDYEAFMTVLNNAFASYPRFPINIVHSFDPKWEYFHHWVDRIRTSTSA